MDLIQMEAEVKRNWVELPPDVMSLIFMKLGTIDILGSAQWVCSSWWKLSKQPHLFRSIHVDHVEKVSLYSTIKFSEGLAREAIDRSCGQLVKFSVKSIATDELLQYMSERSKSMRFIGLLNCTKVTDEGLSLSCKQFPLLEELELSGCSFWEGVFEVIGPLCPHLKSFQLNYSLSYGVVFNQFHSYMADRMALVIAETMPELRHLNLFGNKLTDDGLRAILRGCPHLESLDLRRCFSLKFKGDLKEMSANIKLRLPGDSFDMDEYASVHSFEYCSYDEVKKYMYGAGARGIIKAIRSLSKRSK